MDLPLKVSFVVATGAMDVAKNIFLRVTLQDGSQGYGEVAPFSETSGEDQAACLSTFPSAAQALLGQPATQYRRLSKQLFEIFNLFQSFVVGSKPHCLMPHAEAWGYLLGDCGVRRTFE